jgi:hypothetical protein
MKTYERQSRTAYDEDGHLIAYDFCEATRGTVLQLVTENGSITTLVKRVVEGDVMTGWSWGNDESAVEELRLSKEYALSDSVVLRRGMGVHAMTEINVAEGNEKLTRSERRLHMIGVVAEMGVWIDDQENSART